VTTTNTVISVSGGGPAPAGNGSRPIYECPCGSLSTAPGPCPCGGLRALPAWLASQFRARGLCERGCGQAATVEVAWTDAIRPESLCTDCFAAGDVEVHAAEPIGARP
jgi:hypothetical protein